MRLNNYISLSVALSLSYLPATLQAEEVQANPSSNPNAQDHVVNVAKSGLTFDPPNVKAQKGDTVTFVFFQDGHSVTQTTFANPCAGTKPAAASICKPPGSSLSTNSPPAISSGSAYPTGDNPTGVSATPGNDTGIPQWSPQEPSPSVDTPPPASPPSDYPAGSPPAPVVSATPPPPDNSSPVPVDGAGQSPPTPVTDNPPVPANCTNSPTPPPPSEPAPAPSPSPTPPPTDQGAFPPPPSEPAPAPSSSPIPAPTDQGAVPGVGSGMGGAMPPDMGATTGGSQPCDSKCIEVTGSCQMSNDCTLQQQSPPTTKCKVEDGVCKMCGQKTDWSSTSTAAEGEQPPPPPQASSSTPYPSQDGSVVHWRLKRMNRSYQLSRRQDQAPDQGTAAEQDDGQESSGNPGSEVPADQGASGPTSANATAPSNEQQDGPGLDSGLVKVDEASKASGIRWTITVNDDSKPLWFMSAGQSDCTSGMVFAINAPDSGDTYSEFASVAKTSTCSSAYPACNNLNGEGATAASPPPKCASAQPTPPSTSPEQPISSPNATSPEPTPNSPSSPDSSNGTPPPTDVSATGNVPPAGETPPPSPSVTEPSTPKSSPYPTEPSAPPSSPNVTEPSAPANGNVTNEPPTNGTTPGNSTASGPAQVSFAVHASLVLVIVSLITLI